MRFLPADSFPFRFRKAIGEELEFRLSDYPDRAETEFSRHFPVEALFIWISKNGGLDPEWLAQDDGRYVDDDGNVYPTDFPPKLSGVEQLAAYGLWLIEVALNLPVEFVESDYDAQRINPDGWTEAEVVSHKAECLLLAFQALTYAGRLQHGVKLSADEMEIAETFDFSAVGRKGARKRWGPMSKLREWTISQYRLGEWPSANQAAHDLKESVIAYGRTISATLSEQNAQRTIAEWIRGAV